MTIEITGRFPTGYIEKEKIFCKREELALINSNLPSNHPDKSILRNRLLSKRDEFMKKWNKKH